MDPLDLNDISLLVLCDVAVTHNGTRRHDRIANLLGQLGMAGHTITKGCVPGCVNTLIQTGLLTIRRRKDTQTNEESPYWTIHITDKGREVHRTFITALRASVA